MVRLRIIALCMMQIALVVRTDGHFTVVGPGTIHSERKYNVAVTAHDKGGPSNIVVGIEGTSFNETKTVELQSGETKLVEFDVPYLEEGSYNLTAEGVPAMPPRTALKMEISTPTIKIQTDKGQYQPGDVVNYRLLFLDENLKPDKPSKNTVLWIQDSKGNRISEVRDIKATKGVYTGKFEISDAPALGAWMIRAEAERKTERDTAYFKVTKYRNPKYKVDVEFTKNVNVKDGDVHVVVRAREPCGKTVNAKATVLLRIDTMHTASDIPPFLTKTEDLDGGKAKFDFNVKEWHSYLPDKRSSYVMAVTASVEEVLTGVKINTTDTGLCFAYRYEMRCTNTRICTTFHPETEYDVPISVKSTDGTALTDSQSVVKLVYKEQLQQAYPTPNYRNIKYDEIPTPVNPNRSFVFESHLNESSIAVFKVKLPNLEQFEHFKHYFDMEVEYKDEQTSLSSANQYEERKNVLNPRPTPKDWFYMKVIKTAENTNYTSTYTTPYFKMGEEATVTLNSSVPLTYFIYNIIARGNILSSVRVDLPEKSETYEFKIPTTFTMANYVGIYAYYVDEAGDFHYSETTFNVLFDYPNTAANFGRNIYELASNMSFFERGLPTFEPLVLAAKWDVLFNIEITADKQVRPSQDVILNIKTAPNSYVGLMAYDPIALSLGRKNDLSSKGMESVLNKYVTRNLWHRSFKYIPGTQSGVVTLTNANDFFNKTKPVLNRYLTRTSEIITIPALIFNYVDKDLDINLTLDNTDGEFEFLRATKEIINEPQRNKSVVVPAQDQISVTFRIRPKIVGSIMLKFTAVSAEAADTKHKTLKVEPEGVTEYANHAFFVNLQEQPSFKEKFEFELPKETVNNSVRIEFSVVGDLLGPAIQNLNRLLHLPMGGAEQTMSAMLPNYLMLRYLESINRLTPDLERRIKRNIRFGYQNILKFRSADGSFRPFTPTTRKEKTYNGSTWLTAYVIRSLHQMKDIIKIDESIFATALSFLKSHQAPSGRFQVSGRQFYNEQRGSLSLTASVLLAFSEVDPHIEADSTEAMDLGYKFIVENFEKTESLNEKALAVYALHMAKHELAAQYADALKGLAQSDGEFMWWCGTNRTDHPSSSWGSSDDVKITSYMLLTLLDMESVTLDELLPILKWLVAHRNSYGGFQSSQDTVVGLQALIKFAKKSEYEPAVMDIGYAAKDGKAISDNVTVNDDSGLLLKLFKERRSAPAVMDTENAATGESETHATVQVNDDKGLELQIFKLPETTRTVEFEAKGKGASLMQISYQYNTVERESQQSFVLKTISNNETPLFKLEMDVCIKYEGEGLRSNMAVMEISLPSGYVADRRIFYQIKEWDHATLIETKNAESVIVIYFEHFHKGRINCMPIGAFRSYTVAELKPGSAVVYDYYDISRRATTFFEVVV